tara:strand:- start:568 stop:792 length:225 start_codon:yes stop_codon:yes gene_type:complete
MNYETLIRSVSEIVSNDLIHKDSLTLVYALEANNHKKLSEHFYYKLKNTQTTDFEYTEEFDVQIADITIRFIIK